MNKEYFINKISEETLISMIDRTFKLEKAAKVRSIKSSLLKMIPAVAMIAIVIGAMNILPYYFPAGDVGSDTGNDSGAAVNSENTKNSENSENTINANTVYEDLAYLFADDEDFVDWVSITENFLNRENSLKTPVKNEPSDESKTVVQHITKDIYKTGTIDVNELNCKLLLNVYLCTSCGKAANGELCRIIEPLDVIKDDIIETRMWLIGDLFITTPRWHEPIINDDIILPVYSIVGDKLVELSGTDGEKTITLPGGGTYNYKDDKVTVSSGTVIRIDGTIPTASVDKGKIIQGNYINSGKTITIEKANGDIIYVENDGTITINGEPIATFDDVNKYISSALGCWANVWDNSAFPNNFEFGSFKGNNNDYNYFNSEINWDTKKVEAKIGNMTIIFNSMPILNDGTITLTGEATITHSDGTEVTVPAGTVLDGEGNVIKSDYTADPTVIQYQLEEENKEIKAKIQRLSSEFEANQGNESSYIGGVMLWSLEAKYNRISSVFAIRNNPITGLSEFHNGIDIPAQYDSDIYAANDGIVLISEYSHVYGNYIVIYHGGGITTLYGHANSLLKKVGDRVEKGELIAKVGSSGYSTGNHVHIEVMVDGVPQNPLSYIEIP